jgi:high-affinity iron transporter
MLINHHKMLSLVLFFFISLPALADEKLAIHLLSYLAQDYGAAVQSGKIVSGSEYVEQKDFVEEVRKIAARENFPEKLKKEIDELNVLIDTKADDALVSRKSNDIKWQIIAHFKVATTPSTKPDLSLGKKLYQANCFQCHGDLGHGDGELGESLDPPPTNFHDQKRMSSISPFQAYSTITLGVPGTGMQSYGVFSEHDRWSLAFYVHSLHLNSAEQSITIPDLGPEKLAALSDEEIIKKYFRGRPEEEAGFVSSVRKSILIKSVSADFFTEKILLAREKLDRSIDAYMGTNSSKALQLSIESYLEGIEPIEPLLKNGELSEIEEAYADYRTLIKKEVSFEDASFLHRKIDSRLKEFTQSRTAKSPWNSILLSFGIVFREALESVLVIVLLLSILKKLDAPAGKKWIHSGWVTAIALGAAIYFIISSSLLANMGSVEKLEGFIGLASVLVLLYVGLWFHGKGHIEDWKNFLRKKVHGHISEKNMLGLSIISFTAVFREVIETIIFLKVLQLDGHASINVFQGVMMAAGATVVLGFLMTKFYMKLNIGRLIAISTYFILFLSLMILGKSIYALQLSGILSSTKLFSFSIPLFGIYGTVEGLLSQLCLAFLIGFFLRKPRVK